MRRSHVSRRHWVVAVDLRGHGESDKPQGPYSIMAYAEDLAYVIEHLGLGPVVAITSDASQVGAHPSEKPHRCSIIPVAAKGEIIPAWDSFSAQPAALSRFWPRYPVR